jgi:hypothetical protein
VFSHRFVLGLAVLSLSLSTIACGAQNSVRGSDDAMTLDSARRLPSVNSTSNQSVQPTRVALDNRRDRFQ